MTECSAGAVGAEWIGGVFETADWSASAASDLDFLTGGKMLATGVVGAGARATGGGKIFSNCWRTHERNTCSRVSGVDVQLADISNRISFAKFFNTCWCQMFLINTASLWTTSSAGLYNIAFPQTSSTSCKNCENIP